MNVSCLCINLLDSKNMLSKHVAKRNMILIRKFCIFSPFVMNNPTGPPCTVNESLKVSELRAKNKAEVKRDATEEGASGAKN